MVLPESSLTMSKEDENGVHHVRYRYGGCRTPCYSFDAHGEGREKCEFFERLPTGVKVCQRRNL